MKIMKRLSTLLLAFAFVCIAQLAFSQATVTNDVWLKDAAGNPIYAQGGNISKFGSTYYWVGVQYQGSSEYYSSGNANSDTEFQSINLYTSTDLVNWTGQNPLVTTSTSGFSGTSWVGRVGAIFYNSSTSKYVMWVEYDGSDGSGMACLTSSSLTSGWSLNNVQTSIGNVYDNVQGDSTTFIDVAHSSTPYLVFSGGHGREHAYVSSFNSSGTSINAATLISEWPQGQEGDNMFYYNGHYYLVMSNLAGWSYSSDYVVWGSAIQTPSSYTSDATYAGTTSDDTNHSQCSFVYMLQGSADTSYISVGDRWADFDSSYASAGYGEGYNTWGSVTFNGATPTYNSVSSLTINASTGALSTGGSSSIPTGTEVTIKSQNSGNCLDVLDDSKTEGAGIDSWTCTGGSNQNWELTSLGSSEYEIMGQNAGQVLEIPSSSKTTGTDADQWDWNSGNNQKWTITASSVSGYYLIKNVNSGLCLDVVGDSSTPGALVDQWTCNGGANQNWEF